MVNTLHNPPPLGPRRNQDCQSPPFAVPEAILVLYKNSTGHQVIRSEFKSQPGQHLAPRPWATHFLSVSWPSCVWWAVTMTLLVKRTTLSNVRKGPSGRRGSGTPLLLGDLNQKCVADNWNTYVNESACRNSGSLC